MEKSAENPRTRWGPAVAGTGVVMLLLAALAGASPAQEDFDQHIATLFNSYGTTSLSYREGGSSERTLEEFYSRRQYPGSPPFIPHPAIEVFGEKLACLSCHGRGGWSQVLGRFAPVTPHPEQQSCRQCHVSVNSRDLFVENGWQSVPAPILGRAQLPGGPPPVPHSLEMRGDCYACHVGPGAVTPIRVEHPSRGMCRQCHVPAGDGRPFAR